MRSAAPGRRRGAGPDPEPPLPRAQDLIIDVVAIFLTHPLAAVTLAFFLPHLQPRLWCRP